MTEKEITDILYDSRVTTSTAVVLKDRRAFCRRIAKKIMKLNEVEKSQGELLEDFHRKGKRTKAYFPPPTLDQPLIKKMPDYDRKINRKPD